MAVPTLELAFVATDRAAIQVALSALQRWNEYVMRRAMRAGKPFPPLTRSVAVYRDDPRGVELWQDASVLLASGRGNCDSFSAYEAAWYVVHRRIKAKAEVVKSSVGYHCLVRLPSGTRLDPSERLKVK